MPASLAATPSHQQLTGAPRTMDPTIADSLYHGTFPQVPSRPSPSSAWPSPSRAGTPRSGTYAFPPSALPASFADWRPTPPTSKPTKTFTPPAANPTPPTPAGPSPPAGPAAPWPHACLVTGPARSAPPPPASCPPPAPPTPPEPCTLFVRRPPLFSPRTPWPPSTTSPQPLSTRYCWTAARG